MMLAFTSQCCLLGRTKQHPRYSSTLTERLNKAGDLFPLQRSTGSAQSIGNLSLAESFPAVGGRFKLRVAA